VNFHHFSSFKNLHTKFSSTGDLYYLWVITQANTEEDIGKGK